MESENLGHLVEKLESSMLNTDSRLELLSMRLDMYESQLMSGDDVREENRCYAGANEATNGLEISAETADKDHSDKEASARSVEGEDKNVNNNDEDDDGGLDLKTVRELLSEVHHVKDEYDQLHKELQKVQELQQEVTRSLRKEMRQVQTHFDDLRGRIFGSGVNESFSHK